jgi:hypothetical protein
VLRILVFILVLLNILLLALRYLQPDENDPLPKVVTPQITQLPRIELLPKDLPGGTDLTDSPGSRPAEVPVSQACMMLGPFVAEADFASLKLELQQLFEQVRQRESKAIVDQGYWVFVPPFSSRTEAIQATDQLQEVGASEFYVIGSGNSANAVSLGVYNRLEMAEQRRNELHSLGLVLDIQISRQTDIKSSYWLEAGPVDAMDPVLLPIALNYPQVQLLQVDCTGGVSGAQD